MANCGEEKESRSSEVIASIKNLSFVTKRNGEQKSTVDTNLLKMHLHQRVTILLGSCCQPLVGK
jgi:hypothetical protein